MPGNIQQKKKFFKYILYSVIILFVLIQFIPVDRNNPPVQKEPNWNSPLTRKLAKRACYDCHSNETKWPFYSFIAPVSWFVTNDVHEGRKKFNISEGGSGHSDDAAKEVEKGDMPMWQYVLMHPRAKLTNKEKTELIAGLKSTFGTKKDKLDKKLENEKESD